jgi:hypothetical protein
MVQIHKEFTDSQVKELVERYLRKEIERKYIQEFLCIEKTRFFALIKEYRKDPNNFSIQYTRNTKTRKISENINKLDAADDEEAYVQKPTTEELQDKIKELKECKVHFNDLKKQMEAHGES